jgi:hypothetical protein
MTYERGVVILNAARGSSGWPVVADANAESRQQAISFRQGQHTKTVSAKYCLQSTL